MATLRRIAPVFSIVTAFIALLLLHVCIAVFWAGEIVRSTVLAVDTEWLTCRVRWQDPWNNRLHSDGVDCLEIGRAGENLDVLALPPPFRGKVIDLEVTPFVMGFFIVLLACSAGVGVLIRWVRRSGSARSRGDVAGVPVSIDVASTVPTPPARFPLQPTRFRARTRYVQASFFAACAMGSAVMTVVLPGQLTGVWVVIAPVATVAIAVAAAYIAYRCLVVGIAADGDGITVRNWLRTYVLPWAEVRGIGYSAMPNQAGMVSYYRLEFVAGHDHVVAVAPGGGNEPGGYLATAREQLLGLRDAARRRDAGPVGLPVSAGPAMPPPSPSLTDLDNGDIPIPPYALTWAMAAEFAGRRAVTEESRADQQSPQLLRPDQIPPSWWQVPSLRSPVLGACLRSLLSAGLTCAFVLFLGWTWVVTLVLVIATVAWAGVRLVRVIWFARAAHRAAGKPPTSTCHYVLVSDPDGDPALLLFPDVERPPRAAVSLTDWVFGAIPRAGIVALRGDLSSAQPWGDQAEGHRSASSGKPTVLEADGRIVWPATPVELIDDETGRALVSGIPMPEDD